MDIEDSVAGAANAPDDKPKRKRERSRIEFPYTDVGQALDLVRTLHEKGGGTAEREQLAAWMDQSSSGGTFRSRVSAATLFGFITSDRSGIAITPLGRDVVHGTRQASALSDAFLSVPLFRAMYDQHHGYPLPPAAAIERQVVELGVPDKQKERARQAFQKSATIAGFIDPGSGRFVKPAVQDRTADEPPPEDEDEPPGDDTGVGGGGGGGGEHYHPFIKGLLDALPETGKEWSYKDRAKWLRLAASAFDFMYEGDGEVAITVKGSNAGTTRDNEDAA
ncbi:hypothetical protein [Minwuia sp.]|uniref:hypothetical protein n=1 Tax=Minwuia sp. TaxID=2493630 RepID=UPI003A8ED13B